MNALFPPFPAADIDHFRREIDDAIRRTLNSGQFILGSETEAFEAEFAKFLGVPHVIALGSGTDAIEVMLRAHGIGAGAQVVLPSHAPSAIAAAVRRCGAEVLLADIDPGSMTLCPQALAKVLDRPTNARLRAVLAVHLYGHPVAWADLRKVAQKYGALILEDAAQAHGTEWAGQKVGSLGVAAAFSFYPTKNLAAMGDAGAMATHDEALAARVRSLREYGWRQRHISSEDGVNSRMDELQAAVLRVKLRGLAEAITKRRALAAHYSSRLSSLNSVTTPAELPQCRHAYHQYVIRSPQQRSLVAFLQDRGIPAAIHYPAALHQQPAYREGSTLPHSEAAAAQVISLPLHPYLTPEAVDVVCAAVEDFHDAAG